METDSIRQKKGAGWPRTRGEGVAHVCESFEHSPQMSSRIWMMILINHDKTLRNGLSRAANHIVISRFIMFLSSWFEFETLICGHCISKHCTMSTRYDGRVKVHEPGLLDEKV